MSRRNGGEDRDSSGGSERAVGSSGRGESGLGKSALLDAAVAEWSSTGSGAVVARLTYADSERPWALAGRLMRQLLRLPSETLNLTP